MIKRLLFLFFLLTAGIPATATSEDSLLRVIKNEGLHDTLRIKTCRELAYYYLFEKANVEFALKTTEEGARIAEESDNPFWQAKMAALTGYIKQNYTNDYEGAIKSYFLSLDLYDKSGQEKEKFAVYLNLGNIYYNYNQLDDAIKYYKNAEDIAVENNNEEDIALVYSNLGSSYDTKQMDELALQYYAKAKFYYKKFNREVDIAAIDFNVTNISVNQENKIIPEEKRIKAIDVYSRVKEIFKKYGETNYYIRAIYALGVQLTETGQMQQGLDYYFEAEKLSLEARDFKMLLSIYKSIAENYRKNENYLEEAEFLKKLLTANDSLFTETKSKAIAETQIKYQTEKTNAANEILQQQSQIKDLELTKKDVELTQSKLIRYTLIGGLSLIIIFTGFLFNRFKVTNKQKKIIEHQKLLVEEKNKEVLDSIIYAKRLQEAILPPQKMVKEFLPDSFIFYKPKDIVAGDFYWMETIQSAVGSSQPAVGSQKSAVHSQQPEFLPAENCQLILFAAADCTGHGVPGAMVSVVCSNALNRVVKELNISEPGKILDKVRDLVVNQFAKSDEDVKDGMDISLCTLNKNTNELQYSGANNALWLIRNNDLMEYKPDKQPIGKTDSPAPFKTTKINVQQGDILYLFTDGYADQFGGANSNGKLAGKKFKASNLKKLFLKIKNETMDKQRSLVNETFQNWKGDLEQIDDVCVIGIRI